LRLSDSILQRVRNLVLVSGPDGGITYASPSVKQVLGYEPAEVLGDAWWELTIEDPVERQRERTLVARAARGEIPPRSSFLERPVRTRDGKMRWILWHDSKGPGDLLIGVGVDVTERRVLEEQFRQAQKMEAVGRLAGGVAHDFNNILTAIIGYSDLLLRSASLSEEDRRDLAEIRDAADRAARLTKQLLTFSRKQVVQIQPVNLNDLVQGMEPMLKRLLGEDVTLTTALAPDLAAVEADPGQLEQVIMNLAVNARDAMPDGGQLTIETRNVELDAEYAATHANVVPGRYVLLAVSDTGHGMDESVRAHLFEPFFTTKPRGQGTGLGLATVHGIVHQSGGHIWAYSEVGYGTTMKVYLPRGGQEAAPLEREADASAWPRGTETILVVEDDAGVRKLVISTLAACGYQVLVASTGSAAVELAHNHAGAIHLLVTDVVMPEMNGRAIAQALAAGRPGLPVLYMSGYPDEAMMRHGVLEPGIELIQKPFTPGALARRVREVLDASVRKS
jgi:PAS domain S-box-containing protein